MQLLEMDDEFLDVERQGLGVCQPARASSWQRRRSGAAEIGGAGAGTHEMRDQET
jgi:hypothetical protein